MAGLFVAGIGLFLLLQALFVPKGFGELGHFRPAAMTDNAARPISFAGRKSCAGCQGDVIEAQNGSLHAALGCEACHGAQAKHAANPAAVKPVKLDTTKLCPVCHEANVGKPKGFKQVDAAEHSGGQPCDTCHQPHAPAIGG
jgi:hypothetical protein